MITHYTLLAHFLIENTTAACATHRIHQHLRLTGPRAKQLAREWSDKCTRYSVIPATDYCA